MKKELIQVKVGDTSTCINCEFFDKINDVCIRSKTKHKDCPDFYYRLMTEDEYTQFLISQNKSKYLAVKSK